MNRFLKPDEALKKWTDFTGRCTCPEQFIDGVILWHKEFTPWWTENDFKDILLPKYEEIASKIIYGKKLDKEEELNLSEFDKLRLNK